MDYTKTDDSKRPLWQWMLICLIIAGLIYTVLYYYFPKKEVDYIAQTAYPTPGQSTPSTEGALQITVTATENGFLPQNLTIKTNDTIIWQNSRNINIMVDSSPHPEHTDYPPLNLGLIKPSESKSLSFPTTGTYRYHDHLSPTFFGSITVVD